MDLVVTTAEIKPAFYRAFGETLVVPTLDEAGLIAYEGNRAVRRVVTLDGEMKSIVLKEITEIITTTCQ